MLFLATLLAFSSFLLSPVQAETFVVVNFTLRCDYPDSFIYTATLAEVGSTSLNITRFSARQLSLGA